jgi:hypothetical protein
LPEYLDWARGAVGSNLFDGSLRAYLSGSCSQVGLTGGWSRAYRDYHEACQAATEHDELTVYEVATASSRDPIVLIQSGLQVLIGLFLRFVALHRDRSPVWNEIASLGRLPLSSFIEEVWAAGHDANQTVGDFLARLYREYILGQHEYIALEKLRSQGYDTLKFHYQDGRFYWPFATQDAYVERIRFTALRLFNILTILTDLGYVEDGDAGTRLTADGRSVWQRLSRAGAA